MDLDARKSAQSLSSLSSTTLSELGMDSESPLAMASEQAKKDQETNTSFGFFPYPLSDRLSGVMPAVGNRWFGNPSRMSPAAGTNRTKAVMTAETTPRTTQAFGGDSKKTRGRRQRQQKTKEQWKWNDRQMGKKCPRSKTASLQNHTSQDHDDDEIREIGLEGNEKDENVKNDERESGSICRVEIGRPRPRPNNSKLDVAMVSAAGCAGRVGESGGDSNSDTDEADDLKSNHANAETTKADAKVNLVPDVAMGVLFGLLLCLLPVVLLSYWFYLSNSHDYGDCADGAIGSCHFKWLESLI